MRFYYDPSSEQVQTDAGFSVTNSVCVIRYQINSIGPHIVGAYYNCTAVPRIQRCKKRRGGFFTDQNRRLLSRLKVRTPKIRVVSHRDKSTAGNTAYFSQPTTGTQNNQCIGTGRNH